MVAHVHLKQLPPIAWVQFGYDESFTIKFRLSGDADPDSHADFQTVIQPCHSLAVCPHQTTLPIIWMVSMSLPWRSSGG